MGWLDDILAKISRGSTTDLNADPSYQPKPAVPRDEPTLAYTGNIWKARDRKQQLDAIGWGDPSKTDAASFTKAESLFEKALPLARLGGLGANAVIPRKSIIGDSAAKETTAHRIFWDPRRAEVIIPMEESYLGRTSGFYDPRSDQIVANARVNKPELQATLFHEKVHRGLNLIKEDLKKQGISLSFDDDEGLTRWIEHTYGPPRDSDLTLDRNSRKGNMKDYNKEFQSFVKNHGGPEAFLEKILPLVEKKLKEQGFQPPTYPLRKAP